MSNEKYFIQLSVPKYGESPLTPVIRDGHVMFELNIESDTERSRRILNPEQLMELKNSIERAIVSYNEAQPNQKLGYQKETSLKSKINELIDLHIRMENVGDFERLFEAYIAEIAKPFDGRGTAIVK